MRFSRLNNDILFTSVKCSGACSAPVFRAVEAEAADGGGGGGGDENKSSIIIFGDGEEVTVGANEVCCC